MPSLSFRKCKLGGKIVKQNHTHAESYRDTLPIGLRGAAFGAPPLHMFSALRGQHPVGRGGTACEGARQEEGISAENRSKEETVVYK